MLLAGDELRRTQGGNNNAYNQDNATSWVDWTLADRHRDLLRFVQHLIAFRKAHPALVSPRFYTGAPGPQGRPDVAWHGTRLNQPGFTDPDARALACTIAGVDGTPDLHVMMNMYWEPLEFDVPVGDWHVAIDTFATSPGDIVDVDEQGRDIRGACAVQGRSIIVLRGR